MEKRTLLTADDAETLASIIEGAAAQVNIVRGLNATAQQALRDECDGSDALVARLARRALATEAMAFAAECVANQADDIIEWMKRGDVLAALTATAGIVADHARYRRAEDAFIAADREVSAQRNLEERA